VQCREFGFGPLHSAAEPPERPRWSMACWVPRPPRLQDEINGLDKWL